MTRFRHLDFPSSQQHA